MVRGREIQRAMERGAAEGLLEAARLVLARAQADVPVGDPAEDPDPSTALRNEGEVVMLTDRVAEVRFTAPYAAWQHENQHAHHPRGGKAKYLEDALKATIPQLDSIVAGEVRKNIRGR